MSRATFLFFAVLLARAAAAGVPEPPGFFVAGPEPGPWPQLLGSIALVERPAAEARVVVVPSNIGGEPAAWLARADSGAILIVEGNSALARALGFHATAQRALVRRVEDLRDPGLAITWRHAVTLPVFHVPKEARVFCRARIGKAPLMAGFQRGRGAVLWLAVPPGPQGYERFPYLLQALSDLGLRPLFESRRLWAYFDAGFDDRKNADTQVRQWRQAGIAALHVAGWEYYDASDEGDAYLTRLIDACHREGVLVYAWLELPHVSDDFWQDHPEWREKTALLKDAHVDWRLLMNLLNPDCQRAVVEGVRSLVMKFDWDGVDFAELYFDGTRGIAAPEEFTPFNSDVRADVKHALGFDPIELFNGKPRDPKKLRAFLDYRADLAARLQETWIGELEKMRLAKPHLDLVLTHVDDRFDTSMRDAIGADAARLLKLLDKHRMTFVIEDPASVWHLGPKRYAEIANRYRPLTTHQDRLAVDINIVTRERRVYPTQRQKGAEVAELIHIAAESFARVVYYMIYSISPIDMPIMPEAAAVVTRADIEGDSLVVESPSGVGVRWQGHASVDGRPWPVQDGERVWLPPGKHVVANAGAAPPARALDFTGDLESAASHPASIELTYSSESRAFAKLDSEPLSLTVDGSAAPVEFTSSGSAYMVRLPRGRHNVVLAFRP
jgi:hypothetical protein